MTNLTSLLLAIILTSIFDEKVQNCSNNVWKFEHTSVQTIKNNATAIQHTI